MEGQLFKHRYRIASARWQRWDYTWNGWYFVTIVTGGRVCYFGRIVDGVMALSEAGKVEQQLWQKIPNHFECVRIDEFVVMPNHVHGIIRIDKGIVGLAQYEGQSRIGRGRDVAMQRLYDERNSNNENHGNVNDQMSIISPKPGDLATIIRSFKSACSKRIHQQHPNTHFTWQPRYHDHVIRDEFELGRIRKYIRKNPLKWKQDFFCNADT